MFFRIFDFSHIKENRKNGCDIILCNAWGGGEYGEVLGFVIKGRGGGEVKPPAMCYIIQGQS